MPYIGRRSTPFSIGSTSNTYVQAQGYLTAEVGDVSNTYLQNAGFASNTYLQNAGFASNTYLNTALSTKVDETHTGDVTITGAIEDAQGDVRQIDVTNNINSSPATIPAGVSGRNYTLFASSNTVNANNANFEVGQIVSLYNHEFGPKTLAFDTFGNGVWIAGDTSTNHSGSSVSLDPKGVATLTKPFADCLVITGNVS